MINIVLDSPHRHGGTFLVYIVLLFHWNRYEDPNGKDMETFFPNTFLRQGDAKANGLLVLNISTLDNP